MRIANVTIHSVTVMILLATLLLAGSSCSKTETQVKHTDATAPFAVGQVWSYKNRPGENHSQFVICKIDETPSGIRIIHLAVNGLHMRNLQSPSGLSDNIVHLPFQEPAVRASVVDLVGSTPTLPPFEAGYESWKTALENGTGGVWDVSVADAISQTELLLTQPAKLVTPVTQPASNIATENAIPASNPAQ